VMVIEPITLTQQRSVSWFDDSCPGALGPAHPGLAGRNVWNTSRVYLPRYLPRPSVDRFFLLQLSLKSIDALIAASPHTIADRDSQEVIEGI